MNHETKTSAAYCLCIMVLGSALPAVSLAGSLDPTEPPAPTMVTLQQIHSDLLAAINSNCSGGTVSIPATGQDDCWDQTGVPVGCTGTGQDGEFQIGATQTPRFSATGMGTVVDELTGLIWMQKTDCFGPSTWDSPFDTTVSGGVVAACNVTDGSTDTQWRVPNIRELHSLIDFDHVAPAVPDPNPFTGIVENGDYWTSTTFVGQADLAFSVNMWTGEVFTHDKDTVSNRYILVRNP